MHYFWFPPVTNTHPTECTLSGALMQIASQQKPLCLYTLICSQAGFQLVPCPWAIVHCQGSPWRTSCSLNNREEGKQSYVTDSQGKPASAALVPFWFRLGSRTTTHVARIRADPGKLVKHITFSLVNMYFPFALLFPRA